MIQHACRGMGLEVRPVCFHPSQLYRGSPFLILCLEQQIEVARGIGEEQFELVVHRLVGVPPPPAPRMLCHCPALAGCLPFAGDNIARAS